MRTHFLYGSEFTNGWGSQRCAARLRPGIAVGHTRGSWLRGRRLLAPLPEPRDRSTERWGAQDKYGRHDRAISEWLANIGFNQPEEVQDR